MDGLLKARCEKNLENAYRKIAFARRIKDSDVVREALWDYVQRHARKYGLRITN